MSNVSDINLADIVKFYKVIRITTEKGAILPYICETNEENRSWNVAQHPTDKNTKFSDTVWSEPKTMSFVGFVPLKNWEEFKQLIEGGALNGAKDVADKVASSLTGKSIGLGSSGLGLYEITCLGGVYKNMALTSLSRSETSEINSAFKVTLNFQEALKVEAKSLNISSGQTTNPADVSTINIGEQAAIPILENVMKKKRD